MAMRMDVLPKTGIGQPWSATISVGKRSATTERQQSCPDGCKLHKSAFERSSDRFAVKQCLVSTHLKLVDFIPKAK
jgi:hypothetical protein